MSTSKEFNEADGKYISFSDAEALIEKTRGAFKNAGVKNLDRTHSQFFGKAKLDELLRSEGAEGLKFSFVLEEGNLNELSLLVQAVDRKGNVVAPGGDQAKRSSGGGNGVYGGPKCPRTCIPPMDDRD